MREAVIISVARTAIGGFLKGLATVSVVNLGAIVIRESLLRAGLRPVVDTDTLQFTPDALKGQGMLDLEKNYYNYSDNLQPIVVDEVIMGNVVSAGQGQNVARQAMIRAGIPKETCAYSINLLCASGMKAVALATQSILNGEADVIIAGGMENMSQIPYAIPIARNGARMGNTLAIDLLIHDGLHEAFYNYHMGVTAENVAAKYGISRQAQDEFSVLSHKKALNAISQGNFDNEIASVIVPQKKGIETIMRIDEHPTDMTMEKMTSFRPAFKNEGTVTAGNSCGINDGAASLLIMSNTKAKELGITPLCKIKSTASSGLDPAFMGLGPIPAVRKICQKEALSINDFGTIELNEAFASQAIACMRELNFEIEKTNVLGSGTSLGHPIGCTGARILVTLACEMKRKNLDLGLATLCVGGGMGMATVLENI